VSKHRGENLTAESRVVFVRNVPASLVDTDRLRDFLATIGQLDKTTARPNPPPSTVTTLVLLWSTVEAARACVHVCHGKSPFPECAVPLMAKMEEPLTLREQRLRAGNSTSRRGKRGGAAARKAARRAQARLERGVSAVQRDETEGPVPSDGARPGRVPRAPWTRDASSPLSGVSPPPAAAAAGAAAPPSPWTAAWPPTHPSMPPPSAFGAGMPGVPPTPWMPSGYPPMGPPMPTPFAAGPMPPMMMPPPPPGFPPPPAWPPFPHTGAGAPAPYQWPQPLPSAQERAKPK